MTKPETCVFCDTTDLEWRIVRSEDLFLSFVSKPWFRAGQCLVIPRRHVEVAHELTNDEGAAIMQELGRISLALDDGYGTGILQKYMPLKKEDGIKMNHLHFHVFPRVPDEESLFPVPNPNTYDGFITPSEQEIIAVLNRTRL